jgi:hypothetical protein
LGNADESQTSTASGRPTVAATWWFNFPEFIIDQAQSPK